MIKIIEEPIATVVCKRCKSTLSYDWKDVKKEKITGSMSFPPYTRYYIKCPKCKNHIVVYKDMF